VATPVRCSWQGNGHTQVISRITTFDFCWQGNSQAEGISARAFVLARPVVAPPLHCFYRRLAAYIKVEYLS